ncbi:MAG: MtnX-like HAD-IB family phosphatase [Proteobacteria bacterium]|nr:MtnX-like HAD-IB family phosphatase [Pseudomonadota bacterium]
MEPRTALVTDFDGTVSRDDFFTLVAEKYLTPADLEPWSCYMNGSLSHFEALNMVFSKIRVPETELADFIAAIPLDPFFADVAAYCCLKGIPLYICSAGCDYYINKLIGNLITRNHINLITNHGEYNPRKGLVMQAPRDSLFYDKNVGISKAGVVKHLQSQGFSAVFCGDGPPDVKPARIAQTVFARKYLLDKCREENIITQPFNSFRDVLAYLKEA